MPLIQEFQTFPDEGRLIGQILAGYAILEIDLMHCTKEAIGSLDTSLKTMFSVRGNRKKIKVARELALPEYRNLNLEQPFEDAVSAMHWCLQVRNLYAHCTFWDDNSGRLAFANLEELASLTAEVTDLRGATVHHVDVPHLESQVAYFESCDRMLLGVLNEGNRRANRPAHPQHTIVPTTPPPPKMIP